MILEDLECRAGASDRDRDQWLRERLQGVTATEVRDLKLGRRRAELLREKRGQTVAGFADNQYTAWGRKREPVIAAWVQEHYGLAPESRVFHAAEDSRHLASPDCVGVVDGALWLAEIKTSKDRKAPNTAAYEHAGYYWQMQWQMYVTGAVKCLYVLEQHDGHWINRGGSFPEPEPLSFGTDCDPDVFFIDRDDYAIDELVQLANTFLDEVEAVGVEDKFTEPLARYWKAVAAVEMAAVEKAAAVKALEELFAGEPGSVPHPLGTVTLTAPTVRRSFDSTRFKTDHPDDYARYVKTAEIAGTVRVTAKKGE